MSSEIGLNDVKPGMWVEFDDADGHYAGELHEMKNPESMVDVLIMSMGHKPPLYIETEDAGNLVVFLDFGDGYSTGSARNVHVYESKPETESVKQAEDDDKKPFWKGKTCGEWETLLIASLFLPPFVHPRLSSLTPVSSPSNWWMMLSVSVSPISRRFAPATKWW